MKYWRSVSLLTASSIFGQGFKVGSPIADFSLTQLDGSPTQFSKLKGNVTLVMFISVQCPVSNAYDDRMTALYQDHAAKGVKFVVINAKRTGLAPAVQEHAREHAFPFSVYKKENNVVADRFGATVCFPCREELPKLVDLRAAQKSKGLDFVTISCDEPEQEASVAQFLPTQRAPEPKYVRKATSDDAFTYPRCFSSTARA